MEENPNHVLIFKTRILRALDSPYSFRPKEQAV